MKVLSYIKGNDGSSYHRVFMPNQTIDADVRTVRELKEEDLEWCDILHYSRHSQMSAKFFDELRRKHGFKIVVDTDDWWEVPKDHPKYEFWKHSDMSYQIQSHLMNADAVSCTHEQLASIIPNTTYVLPNALDYGFGQFEYKKQKGSKRVRLLYASTVMNYTNTSIIARAMHKLAHLPIQIVIAGHHESPFFDILVKNLTADGKIPHVLMPWSKAEEYMSNYVGDIGILPSKATEFNSYKSNLKVLEYAALKIPVVCSDADPYRGLPVNYFTGENSFVEQVTNLVTDSKYRKQRGEDLHEFCLANYSLRNFANKRKEVYELV